MKKIIIILLVIGMVASESINLWAEDNEGELVTIKEGSLFSQAAVLMDASTGRILYGKNPELQLAMASTTKIMTCIVALELGDMEDIVTASGYAAAQPKVKLYLAKGEQVRLKDLLYSLMLESHNDSAVAIAEHIGAELLGISNDPDSVMKRSSEASKQAMKAFINRMNEKARALQCYNTWFITPNGLDATEIFTSAEGVEQERFHSTTAGELARIMSYCILQSPQKEAFLEITGTYSHDFFNIEGTRSFFCRNHNAFLNMMEGAISGKTGYTGRAGYCYVGALTREGNYLTAALLNTGAYGSGNKNNKWKDMRKLMEYALTHYHKQVIHEGNTEVLPISVAGASPKRGDYFTEQFVEVEVSGEEAVEMLLADWEEPRITVFQEKSLTAPVRKGQSVGYVEVWLQDVRIRHFDIVCTEEIAEKTFSDAFYYIITNFLL